MNSKLIGFLMALSMFFLIACGGEDKDSESKESSNSSCPLYGLYEEYQKFADDSIKILATEDDAKIEEALKNSPDWATKWSKALSDASKNCTQDEIVDIAKKYEKLYNSFIK